MGASFSKGFAFILFDNPLVRGMALVPSALFTADCAPTHCSTASDREVQTGPHPLDRRLIWTKKMTPRELSLLCCTGAAERNAGASRPLYRRYIAHREYIDPSDRHGCFLDQRSGRSGTKCEEESSQEASGRRYTGPPCRSSDYFIQRAEPQMARTSTLGYR